MSIINKDWQRIYCYLFQHDTIIKMLGFDCFVLYQVAREFTSNPFMRYMKSIYIKIGQMDTEFKDDYRTKCAILKIPFQVNNQILSKICAVYPNAHMSNPLLVSSTEWSFKQSIFICMQYPDKINNIPTRYLNNAFVKEYKKMGGDIFRLIFSGCYVNHFIDRINLNELLGTKYNNPNDILLHILKHTIENCNYTDLIYEKWYKNLIMKPLKIGLFLLEQKKISPNLFYYCHKTYLDKMPIGELIEFRNKYCDNNTESFVHKLVLSRQHNLQRRKFGKKHFA
jgi:hypothetical protein